MKQNQNTIAAIDHKRAIRINSGPFLTFPSAAEKVYIVHRERTTSVSLTACQQSETQVCEI